MEAIDLSVLADPSNTTRSFMVSLSVRITP